MPNQKYDQVVDLLAAGNLNWASDLILGALVQGAIFDSTNTLVSQVGPVLNSAEVMDRYVDTGGQCFGTACVFSDVQGAADYQMVLCKDDGSGDPLLIAWYETDAGGGPLHVASDGSLIVRPSAADPTVLSRLWMVY